MKSLISTNDMFFCTVISLAVAALLLLQNFLSWKNKTNSRRSPPGPPGWPLMIVNLLYLSFNYKAPHKILVEFRRIYGPIFMVRIGAATAVAIASADAAMELFKSHDQAFVNRHPIHALQQSIDDHATIWSPYGPIWRMNRRIYANIFSCTTLKNTLGKRRQFLDQIKQWISLEEKEGRSVEIRHLTSVAVANLLGNLFFSKDVMDLKSAAGSELYQLLGKLGVLVTTPNAADFFPCLRNLDPLNLANRTKKAFHAFRNIIEGFAEERRSTHGLRNNNDAKDYLDLLMDFEGNGKDEPRKLSNRDINWLITEMFLTATDTVATTVEWVMAEVVRNPEVMRKAKDEISQVVGYSRKIEENDIESLPYLDAVVKESMRLHPPLPFLIPRTTVEDTEFMGYIIPKNTAVVVHVWGIGRDPAIWDDPLSFNPERFLGNTTDYCGRHYQFLPFGAGRRVCPGLPIPRRILHSVVGSLLQSFDWTPEDGVTPESIDMNEIQKITLQKSIPLRIIPRASFLAV